MVKVSVVVPTYKDVASLHKCLTSLDALDYPKDLIEIIVVNNDADTDLKLNQPGVKLLTEKRPGSYAARNKGVVESTGEIIAFTDSDCIVDPNWIKNAVKLIEHKGTDRIAGKIVVFSEGESNSIFELYEKTLAFNQCRSAKQGLAVTANLIVRKQLFSDVGLFDSSLFSGGDTEWNKRASEAGASMCYGEQCIIYHPARASFSVLKRKAKRVAGGLALKRGILVFMKLALPPFNLYKDIWGSSNLTIIEKSRLMLLATYLKGYTFICAMVVKSGFGKAARA